MLTADFMSAYARIIIEEIPDETFSSRDFIWKMMRNYERDYIRLLNEDTTEHPIWNVHKQIGKYLADHSNELGISSTHEKEPSSTPFGTDSQTEIWRRI